MDEQKTSLKASLWSHVLLKLKPHVEFLSVGEEQAPVRACYRYISNRPHQLDYKKAIAQDLPIDSGEVESAHRYIIQERLKIAGAWWAEEHAENMLALIVNRANHQWEEYWNGKFA